MGDWLFVVCRTCKAAAWIDEEDVIEYVEDHEGHLFRFLVPEVLEDRERFRAWFLRIMSWPEKEVE